MIKLGYERFRAPEVLFQPGLIGTDKAGVAEILFNTLQAIDIDKRADYYKHIVLCGGGTMFPGFSSRMEREIKQLYCERVFNGDTSKLSVRETRPGGDSHMEKLGMLVVSQRGVNQDEMPLFLAVNAGP